MKEYTFEELLHKAASYCSIAEHCKMEVRTKLTAWHVPEDTQEKIIEKLEADGFIDEKRFCKAYVADKFRYAKWGKVKITFNLREKHLQETDITEALDIIDEGEYDEMLASLLKSKLQHIKYHFEYEKQGKLYRFAQSRGFENFVIERVLRNL